MALARHCWGLWRKHSSVQTWRIGAQTWVEEMVLLTFAGPTGVLNWHSIPFLCRRWQHLELDIRWPEVCGLREWIEHLVAEDWLVQCETSSVSQGLMDFSMSLPRRHPTELVAEA